jgi:hypothetical protein
MYYNIYHFHIMNSKNNSPVINPMARQNIYISPSLHPMNKKFYMESLSLSLSSSSDDSTISSDTNSETNSHPFFSSNESLMSLEDYRLNIGEEKKQDDHIRLSNYNRGIISSVCCWCRRD